MPNKYSHSVVLAHYSSLGLIDLPNDQYITYLKTYPTSRRSSITSASKGYWHGTHGSITPSSGYSNRRAYPEEHVPGSRSVTGRSEHGSSIRRNIIIESDEGSGDEGVVLHKIYEPGEPEPQPRKSAERYDPSIQKRKLPSVSTYTGRSSSEVSERVSPAESRQQAPRQAQEGPKRSPPSIINLNEFEGVPAISGPTATVSSVPKPDHIAAQVKPADTRTPAPSIPETQVYSLNPHEDLNFDGFSDRHLSEVTITASKKGNASPAPIVPRSHFTKPSTSNQPVLPSSNSEAPLPERVDSAAGVNRNLTEPNRPQPQHNRSFESISSMNSEDIMHLTTALPPVAPQEAQKPLRLKPGKISLHSRDPIVDDDAIDPGFFETLRGGPKASPSPSNPHFAALHSHPPPSIRRPSLQSSRQSSDHTPTNPDFWRGLEEMLSDSDSAVFPPDIAKYKPRNSNHVVPLPKADKPVRNGTEEKELKRPTTAPAPKTSSRDAFSKDEPLPEGRSRITLSSKKSLDKPQVAREMATVQLVDTSAEQRAKPAKKGFLRKLRKKNYHEKKP
jgi:hypothetical protein